MSDSLQVGQTWQHVKSEWYYSIIALGRNPETDADWVAYQSQDDGSVCFRSKEQFTDGRFRQVKRDTSYTTQDLVEALRNDGWTVDDEGRWKTAGRLSVIAKHLNKTQVVMSRGHRFDLPENHTIEDILKVLREYMNGTRR